LAAISGVEAVQQDTEHLWQLALKNAIAEADPRLVRSKIETAEVAIFHRIQSFSGAKNALEEHALFDAFDAIRRLKARDAQSRLAPALEKRTAPKATNRVMNAHIRGCGKDDNDTALTLYRLPSSGEPSPLSGGYRHVRCGYRPPSRIQNGILLCDTCIFKLGLLGLRDLSREAPAVGAGSHGLRLTHES
jgi:hypothetical protein